MKSPMTMMCQAAGLIAAPLVLGEMIARLFGRGAWYDIQATGVVLSVTYSVIAAYLLLHSKLLIPRIRWGLLMSLVVIEGVLMVALVMLMTGAGSETLMLLLVYGVMASVPLVLVGLHNLSWSLRQLETSV